MFCVYNFFLSYNNMVSYTISYSCDILYNSRTVGIVMGGGGGGEYGERVAHF